MADRDADFSAFVAARWGSLVRAAVGLGCGPEDARDLAQTALLRCYTSWSSVQRANDPDAYVFRVLLNCLRDSRRRRWWGERPTADFPDGPQVPDHSTVVEQADLVRTALAELSLEQRQVVVLRYFAHLTEQQTAETLGIPPGTAKSRLSRALAALALNPALIETKDGQVS